MIFWIWMSAFIWAIEIRGSFHVTDDVLRQFLNEQKINVGMKRNDVNIEELEKSLRNEFNIITWTSARIDGTRLIIQIKENELKEPEVTEIIDENRGYDLVAAKDGTVVSIITRRGVPLVTEGSEVLEGDILVEGGLPIFNDDLTVRSYQYCQADEDIYLRTDFNQVEILPINYEEKIYSGNEKKVFYLEVMGQRFKLGHGRNKFADYDVIDEKKQARLLPNFYLPLYFGTEIVREYKIVEKKYVSEEAKVIFTERIKKISENLSEKGVQILEKNGRMKKDDINWYLNIHFDVIEKTGKSVPTGLITPIYEIVE
jgi:similar to stage IV sporulation protein